MEKVKVISLKPISNNNETENSNGAKYSSLTDHNNKTLNGNIRRTKSSFASRGSSFSVSGDKHNYYKKNRLGIIECDKHLIVPVLQKTESSEFQNPTLNSKISGNFFPVSANCFGRPDYRASYNEKIQSGSTSLNQISGYNNNNEKRVPQEAVNDFVYLKGSGLYRSNSSLELDHEIITDDRTHPPQNLKREYGSHGSINITTTLHPESIYSLFQTYQQDNKSIDVQSTESISPKGRSKMQRLWDKDRSIFKKLLPSKTSDSKFENKTESGSEGSVIGVVIPNCNAKHTEAIINDKQEEINANISNKPIKRVSISHYDCQSLAFQLNASRLKVLLADRSNTITGASAASSAEPEIPHPSGSQTSTEDIIVEETDHNDDRSNHLVSSCPFFRNEIGGEGERIVSLSREVTRNTRLSGIIPRLEHLHRSSLASSIGLLEPSSGSSYWSHTLCPYIKKAPRIENVDQGSSFYSSHFLGQEHQNWFGVDDQLGPVAISIKREKVEENAYDNSHSLPIFHYRFIVRTSDLCSCQGTLREDNLGRTDKNKGQGNREVIEYVCPQINFSCLRLGLNSPETESALVKLDELGVHKKFKVGVLYCRAGQKTEEDMYNNENSGPAFSEFLEILGQRVRLKNFDKYRGGLDKQTDSTGNYSVYSQYQGCEIMFHISTLLPFTANNRKQLLRKRHIGNDIVTIIFQEPGALPFSPKNIRSHFQHVFIIVQAVNPCTENTMYSVAVSRFQDVSIFGPPIPECGMFTKSKQFADFLLAKVINGELATLRSEKFACMAARTKHEYLKDLTENHSSSTLLDTTSKFSLIGFSRSNKKEKNRFKFVADSSVKGALSWNVSIDDATLQKKVDCILGISVDSIVVLEELSSSVIFSTSCRSILGWTSKSNQGVHIFYHQGECLSISFRQGTSETETEEILGEIIARLSSVTQGAESQELVLKRNSAGLLGFNVQQDGIITEVEPYGLAAQSRLEPGARLVEICTIALATLTQEQMVDLLKTSVTVTVTIIPPHPDGTPRRGCNVPTCSFLLGCSEGDYENLTPPEQSSTCNSRNRITQLNRCDRSLSPPRSGSSSGYGTGSSSHSFSLDQGNKSQPPLQEMAYHMEEGQPSNHKLLQGQMELMRSAEHANSLSNASSGYSIDIFSSEVSPEEHHSGNFYGSTNHPGVLLQRQPPHHINERDYSPPPPPLPARLYQQNKREPFKEVRKKHSASPSVSQDSVSNGKHSPFKAPLAVQDTFESGNYAVPMAIPRPIPKEYVGIKSNKINDVSYYCDYENAAAPRAEYTTYFQNKHNTRRNSSPHLLQELKEENEDSLSKEFQIKSRLGIPKNLTADEKYTDDHLTVLRSEDEYSASSGGSPYGFQKIKSSAGGSTSSPSISSRTQSPHNINQTNHKGENGAPPTLRLKSHNAKNSANRNSASAQSSNLQEELLKLINPDYLSDSESMGAELREKKEFVLPFPMTEENSKTTKDESEMNHSNSLNTFDSISSNSTLTTCANSDNRSNDNDSPYSEANLPFQTIGEVEFSNRKSVFTRSGRNFDHPNNNNDFAAKAKQEAKAEKMYKKSQSNNEGVVLTARPATVISNSSSTSSPAIFEKEKSGSEVTPNKEPLVEKLPNHPSSENENSVERQNMVPAVNIFAQPDINEEWSTLVDTATQAIEDSEEMLACSTLKKQKFGEQTNNKCENLPSTTNSMTKNTSEEVYYDSLNYNNLSSQPPQCYQQRKTTSELADLNGNTGEGINKSKEESLEDRLQHLERALVVEQQRSGQLQQEVTFLRSENKKLQEDSRAAAHQLHQFTEWFFNTIDKG